MSKINTIKMQVKKARRERSKSIVLKVDFLEELLHEISDLQLSAAEQEVKEVVEEIVLDSPIHIELRAGKFKDD